MDKNIIKLATLTLSLSILNLSGCGGGASSPTGNNQPPSIEGISADYTRAGKTYNFLPTAMDPENDSLLFSIENKPDWLQFNNSNGELSGIPDDQDVQQYENIIIKVSDGVNTTSLLPFSLKVMYAEVGEANVVIDPASQVNNTSNGYTVQGKASITVGGLENELNNADLQFEYDADGNLLNLEGDSDVPPVISDRLSLDSGVHAIVGMYTGAEINASMDIGADSEPGILLRDEFRYLVYFLETGVDLSFHGKKGDEGISMGLAGTRTLIISDPTDPFFYYFGSVAGVDIGFGYSFNQNIPYQPIFDNNSSTPFAPLEPFLGQAVLKGAFPISAFKVFDVFEMTGTAVCSPAQLVSCEKPTPVGIVSNLAQALILDGGVDPSQQIKLGINGGAGIKFAILGIDLFEYHLLDIASMIDIGTDREHLALQGVIETGTSSQPSWLPFKPVPDPNAIMIANVFADVETDTGNGDFEMSLYGAIDSDFPLARMNGSININPQGMQMEGVINDPDNPITVDAIVDGDGLQASIDFAIDIQGNINQITNDSLDRAVNKFNQALVDLDNAIIDYEGAVSLDGFRSRIPDIVDNAIGVLNALPQRVYNDVYSAAKTGIDNAEKTYSVGKLSYTFDLNKYLNSSSEAAASATTIRNQTQTTVNARIVELEKLRTEALRSEDTPTFRAALKSALLKVASQAKLSISVLVRRTVDFGFPVGEKSITFYNNTLTYTIIDDATKNDLLIAAANVDDIDPAYTVRVDTQAYYDALPTETAIEEVRNEVNNGIRPIPEFRGAGYSVTRNLDQSIYILLGQDKIEVDFNPLDPVTVVENIGNLISDQLLQ